MAETTTMLSGCLKQQVGKGSNAGCSEQHHLTTQSAAEAGGTAGRLKRECSEASKPPMGSKGLTRFKTQFNMSSRR